MALVRSPEYHWNQIISKSVHRLSRSHFKLFSIYSPGGHFCSTKRNGLSNVCRQSPKEHSCIIISKSMRWLRRSHLKNFLFLALVAILLNGAEQLSNFSRELPKELSCEIISKSVHRFCRRSPFKAFFYL